jgi:hypothetical protein
MAIKSYAERVLKPQVSAMAQYTEMDMIEQATNSVSNVVGTAGSTSFTTAVMLSANQKINENACADMSDRYALLNPAAMSSAVVDRKGLFQSSDEIAKQYKQGYMGIADGFTYLTNSLIKTVTNGNDVTSVVTNGVGVEGASTIAVDGLTTTTGTVAKGSVFTLVGVNAVHPITKVDLGYLQQFVVTADVTANGSGEATVAIYPALQAGADSLQNITALPADGAALVFVGAADAANAQNLTYHKDAFRMASVGLHLPTNEEFAARETYKGITIQIVRGFDINTRKEILRTDFLGGIAATRPEWACRVTA